MECGETVCGAKMKICKFSTLLFLLLFFEKYLFDHKDFECFQKHIAKKNSSEISKYNQRVTPVIHLIIQEIAQTN